MATARTLLARVAKLESARAQGRAADDVLAAMAIMASEGIAAGRLDSLEAPMILEAMRQWRRDGFWGL